MSNFSAVSNDSGPTPSAGLRGTVIPDPHLADLTKGAFAAGWVRVAYVALERTSTGPDAASYYKQKFNFDLVPVHTSLAGMNTLSLCYGTRAHCGVPTPISPTVGCGPDTKLPFIWWVHRMWVKLESASKDKVMYRCVTRRDHWRR